MRELINLLEATLKPRDFYTKTRVDNLIKKLKSREPFETIKGEPITIAATSGELKVLGLISDLYNMGQTWEDVKEYFPNTIGGVKLSSLFKTGEFGGQGGEIGTGVASGEVKANIGETVEALKAAAIFTKLITRTKAEITPDDVVKAIAVMAKNAQDNGKVIESKYSIDVPDITGNTKDHISLDVTLKRAPFQRATAISPKDEKAWGTLQGIVQYVNTEGDLAKYSKFFANNQRRDPVNIAVKGLEGVKTDVETTYIDAQGKSRPLSHLSMSIKAGSDKYEQASGLNEAGNIKFFNILGLSIEDARGAMATVGFQNGLALQPRIKAVVGLYSQAAVILENKMNALTDPGEARFITTVLTNLKNAIRGDQKIVYVNFDAKGTYYKLNPALIDNLANYVDLSVKLVSKKWPYLYVMDNKSGKALFHVRLAVNSSGRLTHVFEIDNLLDLVRAATAALNVKQQPQQITAPQQPATPEVQPELAESRASRIIISPPRQRR